MKLLVFFLCWLAAAWAATLVVDDGKGNLSLVIEGQPAKPIGRNGYEPALSSDGRRVVYTRGDEGPKRTLLYWEQGAAAPKPLISGLVRDPHWSPDNRQIVFLKDEGAKWQPWVMPAVDPAKARKIAPMDLSSIVGFNADGAMLIAADNKNLLWLGLDGSVRRSVPLAEIYKVGQYDWSSNDRLRMHPSNPDLLLVSAFYDYEPPRGAMADEQGRSCGIFLYNLKTKQRTAITRPDVYAWEGTWSPTGDWIYFTRLEKPHRLSIWKMKPDGSGMVRVTGGKDAAVAN